MINNEPELARNNLRRAVSEDPQDLDARADFAELLAKNGENDAATEQLQEILKAQPKNSAVLEALFKVQAQKGDWAAAHATAERVKAEFPKNGLGAHLAGLAYQGRKEIRPQYPGIRACSVSRSIEFMVNASLSCCLLKRYHRRASLESGAFQNELLYQRLESTTRLVILVAIGNAPT
jgi:Tfp pilus assembly protein PilF